MSAPTLDSPDLDTGDISLALTSWAVYNQLDMLRLLGQGTQALSPMPDVYAGLVLDLGFDPLAVSA